MPNQKVPYIAHVHTHKGITRSHIKSVSPIGNAQDILEVLTPSRAHPEQIRNPSKQQQTNDADDDSHSDLATFTELALAAAWDSIVAWLPVRPLRVVRAGLEGDVVWIGGLREYGRGGER